jgi:hypothetical protein
MENFTPCVRCPSSFISDMLRLERHRNRGLFHPSLPMPPSRSTRWYVGRRREMGLRPRPRGQTRQMRDILLRWVSFSFFFSLPFLAPFPPRHRLIPSFLSSQVSTASPRSNRHCYGARRVVRPGDMTIALAAFVHVLYLPDCTC